MAKKETRPIITVPPEQQNSFERVIAAKQIMDKAESVIETEVVELKAYGLDTYSDLMARYKTQPENPRFVMNGGDGKPDHQAIFQVQEMFYPELDPEVEGKAKDKLISSLVKAGLDTDTATKLVEGEVICKDETAIKSFSELIETSPALAERLMKLIEDNFTPDERKTIIKEVDKYTINKGILARLVMYCPTKAQIKAALTVLHPKYFFSSMKYGVSEKPKIQLDRIFATFRKFLFGEEEEQKAA